MSKSDTPVTSARERILETAGRLFYRDGLRATGIDRIIAESGVAKMSFYRNFPSKADLIAACLSKRHETWMQWFVAEVEARLTRRNAGIDVIADVLKTWFVEPDFRGCAFINTVAESGTDQESQDWSLALIHKKGLRDYIEKIVRRFGLARPKELTEEIMLVVEGMIVRYQMTRDPQVVTAGRRLLKRIQHL